MGPVIRGEQEDLFIQPIAQKSIAWELNLPLLDPMQSGVSGKQVAREFRIPRPLEEALQEVVRSGSVSLHGVYMTALQIMLYRYTHDREFVVATSFADAKEPGIAFVRACIADSSTCQQVLEQVEQTCREAREQAGTSQDVPACACYLALRRPTDHTSYQPAFPSIVPFGLTFLLGEVSSVCRVDYNPELFKEWFIEQFYQHMLVVLAGLWRNLECSVSRLPLLTPEEIAQIPGKGRGKPGDYPWSKKLHELFEDQVTRIPQARALSYHRADDTISNLSYQELNLRANVVARELVALGVKRDVAVGVHMDRSLHAIVSLLAILKAGGVYVPLDASYPVEHLRLMIAETEIAVLLTTSHFQKNIPDLAVPTICLDLVDQRVATLNEENVSNATPTQALSLIMFTSGSTGKPKGVRHSQQQVINRLHWMGESHPFRESDVMCQRSPLGVMPSMMELLAGLLHGIPTLIISDPVVKDTPRLIRALVEGRVSHITLVPSLLRLMLTCSEERGGLRKYLRLVTIGGEIFSPLLYKEFREVLPDTRMLFDYGCTETNTILYYTLAADDAWENTPLPGGYPIANLDVYVLDKDHQPVPPGVQGEIYVGGRSLSMGYLRRPELTAEKFIPHPFPLHAGDRLYRTGDLACPLPDGAIRLLGRIDDQVKINGMRIELSGVETVLSQHQGIRESAVAVRTLKSGARQLQAFIVRNAGISLTELDVHQFLEARLPSFMLPARYSFLPALLRTPNGKVDRKALLNYRPITEVAPSSYTRTSLVVEIRRMLAEEFLEMNPDELDENQVFAVLGLDSVLAVEFVRRIGSAYGVEISVTSLYDYPTVRGLAEHVLQILERQKQRGSVAVTLSKEAEIVSIAVNRAQEEASRPLSEDIAIIGMSGRFPQAQNIEEFWHNLAQGLCAVTEVPPERWDAGSYYDPDPSNQATSVSRWGAFLSDIDKFEPLFFNISPAEARVMDPQQRLCLEESWKALEHAGYCPDALHMQKVGVFVGAKKGDYAENFARTGAYPQGDVLLGNDLAMLAARIAYHMDFHGPCLTVDTSCSSSLVAAHLACQSLRLRESNIALVGGVCVVTNPQFSVATSKLGILSPTGKCRTFDNEADGFVQGEGVVFLVLKPLAAALHDRDTVYGVIKASAVNHDGKTNGIGAPNGRSQALLQSSIYQQSGINPDSISYVEAHGTGTKIGDPIEINALTNSFGGFSREKQYCALGSIKPNIGHLTAAAGVAGLVKILLCFKQKQLPPTIHYQTPNEHIPFLESPFYVNTDLQAWNVRRGSARRAAINSFGLGGTNVHCILQEPPETARELYTTKPVYIVPVSARTPVSLKQKLVDLQSWIETAGKGYSLRDISYTLLLGRKHFPICCVYLATDLADLLHQIRRSQQGNELHTEFLNVQSNLPPVDPLLKELADYLALLLGLTQIDREEYIQKMRALAALMIKGVPFSGEVLFRTEKAYRIPLPTYPFLRERCWFAEQAPPETPSFDRASRVDAIDKTRHSAVSEFFVESPRGEAPAEQSEESTRHREICLCLSETLGRLLEVDPALLTEDVALEDYGFDSIRAVSLKYELEHTFACEVPVELIVQGSTIEKMSRNLLALPSVGQQAAKDTGQNTQPAHLKTQFLDGGLSLTELGSEELDILFDQLVGEAERINL